MVASKGGVSYEAALNMTVNERRKMLYALAVAHDADVNWETGAIRPPKSVQSAVSRTLDASGESMRFGA